MLDKIIGQKKAKETVQILIDSVKATGETFPHILLTGFSGSGKSTFARAIATELGVNFIEVNSACTGSNMETKIKLMNALESIEPKTLLFLDEIHQINKSNQEILYTAMEDGYISYSELFGMQTRVNPFTLMGATTDLAGLTNPMQNRFKYVVNLDPYANSEISTIIDKEAMNKSFSVDSSALAEYCRGNPRIAKNYLDWIHKYCLVNRKASSAGVIKEAMEHRGVYKYGLTQDDLRYIDLLRRNRIMGVRSISHTLNIPEKTVKNKIEPYLLSLGIITILTNMQNRRGINLAKLSELEL